MEMERQVDLEDQEDHLEVEMEEDPGDQVEEDQEVQVEVADQGEIVVEADLEYQVVVDLVDLVVGVDQEDPV